MTPRPVLFLVEHLDVGGTEHHVLDLMRGLDRDRFELHVVHFADPQGRVARKLAGLPGIELQYLPVSRAYAPSALQAIVRLRRLIERRRIAVVMTYHFVADWLGAWAARGRAPVISNRRDTGFTRTPRQRWAGRWLARRGAFARYVAVSRAAAEALARTEGVDRDRIEVIYNGVDPPPSPPERDRLRAAWGLAAEEFVVACVANFNPVKRHEDLIAAFDLARRRWPQRRWRLLLAGQGPLEGRVRAAVEAAGLGEAVVFLGHVEEPAAVFAACDAAALASLTEGFANSVVQAMVAGKPVVATGTGGTPEAIDDGRTGLLVPPGDPAAMAGALVRLARDADLGARLGAEASAAARARFSRRAMLAAVEALLDDASRRFNRGDRS